MVKIVATLFVVLLAFVSYSQPTVPQDVKDNIKSRVDNGINPAIVVGIVEGDKTVFYAYGVRSLSGKEPVDEHSVFEIGSITKTFTGILLAESVGKGKMSLEDPLQKYLPAGVTAPTRNGAVIKLLNLSNHTSSLPRMPSNFNPADPANPFVDYTEKLAHEFLGNYVLTRDIGSQYEYSNYAQGILGHILAAQRGTNYETLMVDVIAKPLGMADTRLTLTPNMKKNLALGHSEGVQVQNWDFDALAGCGAIRSNAVDMIRYIQANMGTLKSNLYPAMQLSHKNTRGEGAVPKVGLGWHIVDGDNAEIVWHNGGTGGYRAFAGFIKGGNKGVVVLTNSTISIDDLGLHLLNSKVPLPVIKKSISLKIRSTIDAKGVSVAPKTYADTKKDQGDQYDFSENELDRLGDSYLSNGETDKAIAVYSINVQAYPESSAAVCSLGEAQLKKGDKEKAIESFRKSVALNPGNQEAIEKLKQSGVEVSTEITVDNTILDTYVGQYDFTPAFSLAVTREGNQLTAQATGQPAFPVFPKSQNVFYLKVVQAQLTFNKDSEGKTESVTLHQNGRDMVAKRR